MFQVVLVALPRHCKKGEQNHAVATFNRDVVLCEKPSIPLRDGSIALRWVFIEQKINDIVHFGEGHPEYHGHAVEQLERYWLNRVYLPVRHHLPEQMFEN